MILQLDFFSDNNIMKKKILITLLFAASFFLFAKNLYKEIAVASFYGEDFDGKLTSNGELFDMNDYTCAHRTLPFDTMLCITNLANGKSVKVRVNDRGPFVLGREIDLSTAAAKELDMTKNGTTNVMIEVIKLGPDTALSQQTAEKAKLLMAGKKSKTESHPEGTLWDIQVGAYNSKENAKNKAKELSKAGFRGIVIQSTSEVFRVALKAVDGKDIPNMTAALEEKGFNEYIIRPRKAKTVPNNDAGKIISDDAK